MNIVYLIENKSKKGNPKYYIGSKAECEIQHLDGVDTIVSLNTYTKYLGSSSNPIMKREILDGNIFESSILEIVGDRDKLREVEEEWLTELDVEHSSYFYNLTNKTMNMDVDMDLIVNEYGETRKQLAKNRSSIAKRVSTSIELGFNDPYEMSLFIKEEREKGKTWASISRSLGRQRHFAKTTTNGIDLDKLVKEDPNKYIYQVSEILYRNGSLQKASEILSLELPTVIKASLSYNNKRWYLVKRFGSDEYHIGQRIAEEVLKGKTIQDASADLGIDRRTGTRYFTRFFQSRFKINDLERT